MAFPDDLDYTEGERLELLADLNDAIVAAVRAAELANTNYSEVGRAALWAEIESLIDGVLPPAA